MKEKTYEEGYVDALKDFGTVCASNDCSECPLASSRDISCQELMMSKPETIASLLHEARDNDLSYYNEYCLRFPQAGYSLEELSDLVCRKALFGGDTSCSGGDCYKCWQEKYIGDNQ